MNTPNPEIRIRPLREIDLPTADRVMRLAFGTFIGLPDPAAFMGDGDYVHTRWRAAPDAAFAAEVAGEIVGSNFATNWGSCGFFGPLTIRPDLWDRGVAQRLMEPVMTCFERWRTRHAGLFTFAQSAKHLALYQKFGFWPRFLTAVMSKPVQRTAQAISSSRFSELPDNEKESALTACRDLTNAVFEGLDVTREIRAVADQGLGDTVLLWDNSRLAGLAVCHCGPGTEAGSGTCYVKIGAARPGISSEAWFTALLSSVEQLAHARGLSRLVAGVNTGRDGAYRTMLNHGFRTDMLGVSMHRPNDEGYSRTGVFVLDDWR
jgi:GNAT superfamily N-acetyltransferase